MQDNPQQYMPLARLTRQQLLDRWGLKAPITLRRYEKAGKLNAMRISSRVILYDLREIERIEANSNTAFHQGA